MKRLLFLIVLLAPKFAIASPYFRLMDPNHIQRVMGALVDPIALGNTSLTTAFATVTHAPADGCLMPSIVCEDWSPALVGLSYNGGRVQASVGPAANLTPFAKVGILKLLNLTTKEGSLEGAKALLSSQPVAGPDVSMSFGPALAVAPIDHGVILPLNAWKGMFRIFAGAAFRF